MLFLLVMYPTHFFDTVPSTNSLAKKLAENLAPHGTTVVAANQTEGRGRLGKSWYSASGKGLYCSIIARPRLDPLDFPKITLAAGLGTAIAIDRIAGVCTQLKWPNDIFLNGKKCGGILTESSSLNEPEDRRYAVIGIGLNLSLALEDFPEELHGIVTSLSIETGICFGVEQTVSAIRDEVLQQIDVFINDGFHTILTPWKQRDFLFGKEMECVSSEGKVISGVSLGPDAEGQLYVKTRDERIHRVLSGDIRIANK